MSKEIGLPATLEQCAEECSELAQQTLKLQRILRGENPTPANKDEVIHKCCEEAADVMVCIDALIEAGLFTHKELSSNMLQKTERWVTRVKKFKNEN